MKLCRLVLYRKRVSRGEINFIRGVNSGFILRALEVRGLVKKSSNKDARVYEYGPTLELLSFMGVTKIEDLPRFEEIRETLETKLKIKVMKKMKMKEGLLWQLSGLPLLGFYTRSIHKEIAHAEVIEQELKDYTEKLNLFLI